MIVRRLPEFGRLLRRARLELGRSLTEMGAELQRTPSYVSETERGKRQIRRAVAERFIRVYRLHAPSALAFWLIERCRHDRVLKNAREPLTFMQHCRRRRLELGLSSTDVARRADVGSLLMREHGDRLPPKDAAARRLLAVLELPASLAALAARERVIQRKAIFLPTDVPAHVRQRVARERERHNDRRRDRQARSRKG